MKFEKIAELAGDIRISEERKQAVLIQCKREYISQQQKSPHLTIIIPEYAGEKPQVQ